MQNYLQLASRLSMAAALFNVLAGVLYILMKHWLFAVVWLVLAMVNSVLAYVFGKLSSRQRECER